MEENSREEDIKNLNEIIELSKEEIDAKDENITAILDIEDLISLEHILSDYKRVLEINEVLLKENEELTISNKEIDKECSRLEKKEVELINENEHYKYLIYALKTYYDITEEDLEKCMKNDR